jgi:hypothetical protein
MNLNLSVLLNLTAFFLSPNLPESIFKLEIRNKLSLEINKKLM